MTDIYDQHRAAFAQASAYVILDSAGERVATIAVKFPRDGAGRLYAYVHWIGVEMVRGWASGGGYDKTTAAISSAAKRLKPADKMDDLGPKQFPYRKFIAATEHDGGDHWDSMLRKAGFRVLQAV